MRMGDRISQEYQARDAYVSSFLVSRNRTRRLFLELTIQNQIVSMSSEDWSEHSIKLKGDRTT